MWWEYSVFSFLNLPEKLNNTFSMKSKFQTYINNLKYDLPAGLVVFLVAIPLCLGIALASGAPLFAGIIAGMVGGVVVGMASGSQLGVSGPAAGLTVIVLGAIQTLGYEVFLLAVVLAGIFQIALGYLKAGVIGYYFPSSVIKGMLAGIGVIIILKQIPHAFGYDADYEGDLAFQQPDGENTFSELFTMLDYISPGAVIITLVALAIMLLWERPFMKRFKFTQIIQGPLVAVAAGVVLNIIFQASEGLALNADQLVALPVADSIPGFFQQFTFPDFANVLNGQIIITAATLAVVASLESLLSVEAVDKLDPHKRVTPTNRELKAQGLGNIVSGLIGGLPVTQVIIRSSTNVQSGGQTKISAVFHGLLILLTVMFIPQVLNMVPLATLAAVLLLVGYKLAKVSLFKTMYQKGWSQFIPFIVTIVGIVFTDLLIGIALGLVVAVYFVLYNNYKKPYFFHSEDQEQDQPIRLKLAEDVTFLNKASILQTLHHIPEGRDVIIDGSRTVNIDQDVLEIFEDFKTTAEEREIQLHFVGLDRLGMDGHPVDAFKKQIKEEKVEREEVPYSQVNY